MSTQTAPTPTLEDTRRRLSRTPWFKRQGRIEAAAAARVARRREQAADAPADDQPPAAVHQAVATVQLTYRIPLVITTPADANEEEVAEFAELFVREMDEDQVIARGSSDRHLSIKFDGEQSKHLGEEVSITGAWGEDGFLNLP